MRKLSDPALIEAYHIAKQLQLDTDFILLLLQEIRRRGIQEQAGK